MALRPQQVIPELLNKVNKALGITALDQWYYVPHHKATKAIGKRALNKFGGSLSSFLKHAYPLHNFDEEKLASRVNKEKDQRFVEVIIRKLFPNEEIQTKARKAVGIINPETDAYLEIDFWIPSLKLGIEYQDKHHYGYQWYANEALEDYQKRDDIKKATMSTLGYTLVTIGYWWDKTIESVAATIRKYRPDLLNEYEHTAAEPISLDPPTSFSAFAIPGVAGIMSPFVPINNFNPTNWFAGEKYDGIRGVYNPKLNKMFSRSGNELSILPALLKDIPNMLVEGEIMAGRGNYNKIAVVSNHTHLDKVNWPMFRYVVFDIPNSELGNYTQRYSAIIRGLSKPFIFAQPVFRVSLINKSHLKMLVDSIISDSGEGAIAQQDARYEYGRAKGLAKIKVRRDADAQVIHVNKHSCTCKLSNGVTADITFCDSFDPSKLKEGDIISYYYHGYAQSGMPKRAEIYKIRYDISWEAIIGEGMQNISKRRSVKEALGSRSLISRNTARNKTGHWNKSQNVRAFFDEFARAAGFDPLVEENWYSVRVISLQNAGGSGLLSAYNNISESLAYAYPELTFEAENFVTHQKKVKNGYWNNSENVRAFFNEFARTAEFDPMLPENWYSVTFRALRSAGGAGLLATYSYNIRKALSKAYPEMKFKQKFRTNDKSRARNKLRHWSKPQHVRAFFDEYARTSGFDPLVPDNWYPVRVVSLRKAGGGGMLKAHGANIKKALSCAYPELQFEAKNFITHQIKVQKGHWNKSSNVRAFFEEYARTAGFDPLVAENWIPVWVSILRNAGGSGMLKHFRGNKKNALSFAFPELQVVYQ